MLIDLLRARVMDDTGRLNDPDHYRAGLDAALAALSRWRPVVVASDLTGAGSRDVALPAAWEAGFSEVRRVEVPVGRFPECYLEPGAFTLYDAPAGGTEEAPTGGLVLRLADYVPAVNEAVRVWWTRQRAEADVGTNDADAVVNLAAAHCLEVLANLTAHTTDPTILADSVSHQSRSRDFAARAKSLRALALAHFGIKEGETAPAVAVVAPPRRTSGLTHRRCAS